MSVSSQGEYKKFLNSKTEFTGISSKKEDQTICIQESPGRGLGCFAMVAIPAGSIVCYYTGMYVPNSIITADAEYHKRLKNVRQIVFAHTIKFQHPSIPSLDNHYIDARNFALLYKNEFPMENVNYRWACGGMINSSLDFDDDLRCEKKTNVRLAVEDVDHFLESMQYAKIFIERTAKRREQTSTCLVGYAAVPMVATRKIIKGEELMFRYDWVKRYDPSIVRVFEYEGIF